VWASSGEEVTNRLIIAILVLWFFIVFLSAVVAAALASLVGMVRPAKEEVVEIVKLKKAEAADPARKEVVKEKIRKSNWWFVAMIPVALIVFVLWVWMFPPPKRYDI
jgi:H+/Cl- antiporter ClcA